jgi:putative MATE family efflux protein
MSVIMRFMLPLLVGNIFQQLYNMADTVIVGRFVGQNALAAVGSTGTIMFLVIGFAQGLSTGFTVLTSQRYGARDEKGTKKSVSNAILLSAIVAVVVTLVSSLSMHGVLILMNTPAEIFEDAQTYIVIICLGTVCSVYYNLFSSMMRAVGDSKMPLFFLVFSACLNVVLDLVFIIVFHMGVAGAAFATDLSQGISAVLCIVYIKKKMAILQPEKGMWRLDRDATSHQMRVGLPMALQFAITASGTMIMQAAINIFGADAVAAFTAAGKIQNILTQWFTSTGMTMASYCGQNYGKGDLGRIRGGVKAALISSTLYAVAAGVLVNLLLRPSMSLFFAAGTDLTSMMPYASRYILLCTIFYIPLGMIFIFRNTMQGCGYGLLPMLGGVVELLCRLVMALLSIRFHSYPMAAFCDPFAWLGAGIFTMVCCIFVLRDVERTLKERTAVHG